MRCAHNAIAINIGGGSSDEICPDDTSSFRNIMLISIAVGGLSSVAFHVCVKPTEETNKKVSFVLIYSDLLIY